ncbi:MAG TPA: hypothetical protein VFW07_07470 [Parafilimonas sp.]|nr:hypothetical protein [Parafilimonas sp.]
MKDQLPAFVLADLFSDSLVHTGENLRRESNNDALPKQEKNYLGNYDRKIIVLVNDKNNMYLNDEEMEFLTGILNACKLNFAHIALINFSNNPVDFNQLRKKMQAEYLLMFGVSTLQVQLPFTMPDYQVQQYDNCKIVTAPSLNELNKKTPDAKTQKTKLWKSLQNIFSL